MSSYIWKKKVNEPEVILPARDQEVLDKYTRRMKRFDECIKVCCCWIGWDLLLGRYYYPNQSSKNKYLYNT